LPSALLRSGSVALTGLSSNGAESWEVPVRALMGRGYTDGLPEQNAT
jgi:hypothetical protein